MSEHSENSTEKEKKKAQVQKKKTESADQNEEIFIEM